MSNPPNLTVSDRFIKEGTKVEVAKVFDAAIGSYRIKNASLPATKEEAQDLALTYIIADADPNEEGVNWLDAATATSFPSDAKRNDLIRNDTDSEITLDGIAIASGEIRRSRKDNPSQQQWEIWGSAGEAIFSPYGYFKGSTTSGQTFTNGGAEVILSRASNPANKVSEGWEIQGNYIVCTKAKDYDLEWSGSWSGSSDSGWAIARLYVTRGGTEQILNHSFSNYIEQDGIGDRSGGQFSLGAFNVDFAVGDRFRILVVNANSFGATLHDWRINVKEFVPSARVVNSKLVPVEDSDVVLIDVEGVNNTFYPFSTGETWAQVKANYTRLIVTGNASQSGTPNIRPYSRVVNLNPTFLYSYENNEGGSLFQFDSSLNGVNVWANNPADGDTGFTYRQSGGDTASNGRMAFIVVAQKASKTVIRPEDVTVNDQSSSGYFDIGTMRMQWGRFGTSNTDSVETVTLPVPFQDNNYSVVLQPTNNSSEANIAQMFVVPLSAMTATSFGVDRDNQVDSFTTTLMWQATGVKP